MLTLEGMSMMKRLKNKKISARQVVRHGIQLAAFLLLPGLFISTFSAIKAVYLAVIQGTFSFSTLAQPLLLLLAIFPVTILWGRFFCGYLCSFGAMGDLLWGVSGKLFGKPLRVPHKADRLLKGVKYLLLLGIVVLFWTLGAAVDSMWNPWTVFGVYSSVDGWSSLSGLATFGGVLLLLIMAGSLLVERFFCRYCCPLGAVFELVSRFRLFQIRKPRKNCGACSRCTRKCSMGIDLTRCDAVNSGACIDCFACIDVCPRGNAAAVPAPAVAATLSAVAMTGLYYAGNLMSQSMPAGTGMLTIVASAASTGQYQDGVYTGSAAGFKGTTTVQVTVENGAISDVTVRSTDDDEEFFSRAKSTVISEILALQTTEVDTVTGATFSSNAIIKAVADALGTAAGSSISETTEDSTVTESEAQEETTSAETSQASGDSAAEQGTSASSTGSAAIEIASLADGVYSGTGTGFRGDVVVSVTVANGQITSITVESYVDDAPYFSRAQSGVVDEILSQQRIDVDTVSGATFSSNGIIEAVANALGLSYENTNSTLDEAGHGGFHGGAR